MAKEEKISLAKYPIDNWIHAIAVNLSVPEEVDADLTKQLLEKYDLQSSGSLVRAGSSLAS